MTLLEQLSKDMIASMKEKDTFSLGVIRMAKGAIQLEAINKKKELTEDEMIAVVAKQIKMRNDSIEELLQIKWDYIFFTGGTRMGRVIATCAAKNLTPVTLELGGKNPCIVDETADIATAAKRIVWGKFTNSGQTCVAPDYLIVNKNNPSIFLY